MISEQNKQEAEKVLSNYEHTSYGIIDRIRNAIINRQSVLEALDSLNEDFITMKLRRNITEQIEFLKSKL